MSATQESLSGHVALITGAAGGIGAAVARRLAAADARVVLVDLSEDGSRVAEEIGERAEFVRTDVSDDDALHAAIDGAAARYGRLDCLVNNAGLPSQHAGVSALDLERYDRLMRVNLRAPLVAMRRAAPVMAAAGSGSIVNVASVSAHRAGFSGHDYCAAKAGLLHLTRSVAVELGEQGVRVNSVSPGPIDTGIQAKGVGRGVDTPLDGPSVFASLLPAVQPLARVGVADDVAAVIEFLASPQSSFVNGHDLVIDGGIMSGRPWNVMQSDWATIAAAT